MSGNQHLFKYFPLNVRVNLIQFSEIVKKNAFFLHIQPFLALFLFYLCGYLAYLYAFVLHTCLVPMEAGRGHQNP